jgi:hypothetical protein
VLKVHAIDTVPVRALRDGIRVARPQRARRPGQIEPERVRVLPEPVDVRRRGERRLHVEVLRLENERVRRGCDEHLACARARDVERVRRGVVHKLELRRVRVYAFYVRVCRRPR